MCTVIAKDLTDKNDTPIVVLLSLALKQESIMKKSNASLEVFDFRAVRQESNFTSLPTPSDNDLIQPWSSLLAMVYFPFKLLIIIFKTKMEKTWIAACSEKKIVLKS